MSIVQLDQFPLSALHPLLCSRLFYSQFCPLLFMPRQWWEVRRILDKRTRGRVEYLVDWAGTDPRGKPWEPSWEPVQNVNAPKLIRAYEAKLKEDGEERDRSPSVQLAENIPLSPREMSPELGMDTFKPSQGDHQLATLQFLCIVCACLIWFVSGRIRISKEKEPKSSSMPPDPGMCQLSRKILP